MKKKNQLLNKCLIEVLDSEFKVLRDSDTERSINSMFGNKIHSAHTKVMHSQHMLNNGHSVLRVMRPAGEYPTKTIEYHFFNRDGDYSEHRLDNKSMLHAMKIIHDDAIQQLGQHRTIKFQADDDDQHGNYLRLAKKLAAKTGKSARDVGYTTKLDGTGDAPTCVVEEIGSFPRKPSLSYLVKQFTLNGNSK